MLVSDVMLLLICVSDDELDEGEELDDDLEEILDEELDNEDEPEGIFEEAACVATMLA